MFAIGRLKVAAAAVAGSWLVVIVACLVLVPLVPARQVVAALALGSTIGQTVVASRWCSPPGGSAARPRCRAPGTRP